MARYHLWHNFMFVCFTHSLSYIIIVCFVGCLLLWRPIRNIVCLLICPIMESILINVKLTRWCPHLISWRWLTDRSTRWSIWLQSLFFLYKLWALILIFVVRICVEALLVWQPTFPICSYTIFLMSFGSRKHV